MAVPATHPLTAAFVDRALETEYARESFELSTRPITRFTVTLSAVVFLAYGVHDPLVMPAPLLHESWAIRYGIGAPALALVLVALWSPWYARVYRPAMFLFVIAINAVVIALGAIVGGEIGALQASWAPLFVVLGPFIVRFDVASQLAYALVTLALYDAITLPLGHYSWVVVLSINVALVAMGFIGVLVARQTERQSRELFMQRRTIRSQLEALDAEKQKSEALLLNVLPAAIAERLKVENRPIADGFAEVSVLFADIVGFTRLSSRLSPEQLVSRLNELFSAFDDLLDKFRLEKIKTIGDAYMVVGGLNGGKDHAVALTELALDMLEAIEKLRVRYGEDFSVRIGINTGPVVGGVIGKKKFIYDVWGDTVNIASRMESAGVAGSVQVSDETYRRIRAMYEFEDRGEIEVKGKGPMRTWLVKARKTNVMIDRSSLVA
ncbi:MAG TPA: adenylate/guanylate cyclase domain-containing protein [Polyangiaceae bacterium]